MPQKPPDILEIPDEDDDEAPRERKRSKHKYQEDSGNEEENTRPRNSRRRQYDDEDDYYEEDDHYRPRRKRHENVWRVAICGYICIVIAFAATQPLLAIGGLIFGIYCLATGHTANGAALVILSLLCIRLCMLEIDYQQQLRERERWQNGSTGNQPKIFLVMRQDTTYSQLQ